MTITRRTGAGACITLAAQQTCVRSTSGTGAGVARAPTVRELQTFPTMSDIYFAGDPDQDSARRHMERVLKEPQRRRWPFLAALFAGGTAFTIWKMRQNRRNGESVDASPAPASAPPKRSA